MQFEELPLDHRLQSALALKQLTEATDIQQQAIPHALLGKDLIASSKTGSGKTLAFLLPAVHRLLRNKALSRKDPRALILAPTRELAKQVFMQLKWLSAKLPVSSTLIVGGENFNDQVKSLRRNPHIIVGTAGRVADHLKDRSLYLNGLELLIMDEADRMLDLGFVSELKAIDAAADHRKRQTMMFSATLDNAELHHLTRQLLKAPQRISIGKASDQHKDIEQSFYFADHVEHKEQLLLHLVKQLEERSQAIVFTATRADTDRLAKLLTEKQISSTALSADLNQSQRNAIVNEFSRDKHQVLVTTDVASRGLDLRNVGLVINFDLPKLADEYVHRVGRTGRAGDKGIARSFVGPKDWRSFLSIRDFLSQDIAFSEVEDMKATFSGYAIKPKAKRKGKDVRHKGTQKRGANASKKPQKRVRHAEGTEVGSAPMLRKKRAPEEPSS